MRDLARSTAAHKQLVSHTPYLISMPCHDASAHRRPPHNHHNRIMSQSCLVGDRALAPRRTTVRRLLGLVLPCLLQGLGVQLRAGLRVVFLFLFYEI